MASKSKIQKSVESKLERLLSAKQAEKPEKEELQIVSLAIKYLSVAAKLDESNWGEELTGLESKGLDPANELETDD